MSRVSTNTRPDADPAPCAFGGRTGGSLHDLLPELALSRRRRLFTPVAANFDDPLEPAASVLVLKLVGALVVVAVVVVRRSGRDGGLVGIGRCAVARVYDLLLAAGAVDGCGSRHRRSVSAALIVESFVARTGLEDLPELGYVAGELGRGESSERPAERREELRGREFGAHR